MDDGASDVSRDALTERLPLDGAETPAFGSAATTPPMPSVSLVGKRVSRPPPRRWIAFSILGLVLCAAAGLIAALGFRRARSEPATADRRIDPLAPTVILRLQGSNTIGAALAPALAEAFLRRRGSTVLSRHPGSKPLETLVAGRSDKGDGENAITIFAEGSSTAFTGLAQGSCEIGMSSRAIKVEEAQDLERRGLGDLRSPAGEHVLALDGLAVVVHPNNPLHDMDLAKLAAVFRGDIGDWSAVGSPAGPIRILARDDASGTYDTFRHLVLGNTTLSPNARRFADSQTLSDAVASDPSAIGFIGLVYIGNAKPLAIHEGKTRALFPSPFTVATEDYPLARRLYLYTPVRTTNPVVTEFVNFALSAEGQRVVRESGFVDLNVSVMEPRTCGDDCSPRYAVLTRSARRLSLDFRFLSGSAVLDSRGQRDLERLVRFLGVSGKGEVMLLGFSDNRGAPASNMKLALDRVKVIEEELTQRGVRPTIVEALGDQMPVASNATDSGREKNRRVEVWLTTAVPASAP
jgi:phosphate transport system substrate-binding protein